MLDQASGNLIYRKDEKRSFTETFGYDDLNRLTAINGPSLSVTLNYNFTGNTIEINFMNTPNYITIHSWRWESNNIFSLKNLFYSRLR